MSVLSITGACRQDMHDQPKYKPYRPSPLFEDGLSSRPLVPGTIPRGYLREDAHLYTGKALAAPRPVPDASAKAGDAQSSPAQAKKIAATYFETLPFPITRQVLLRGQERFNIYCSVCHGRIGNGEGMISKRGFRQPQSFHIDRLRQAPVGYFFDAISNGFGAMPDYADKITPDDRWAIVAFIRALQLSQHATLEDIPPGERDQLGTGGSKR